VGILNGVLQVEERLWLSEWALQGCRGSGRAEGRSQGGAERFAILRAPVGNRGGIALRIEVRMLGEEGLDLPRRRRRIAENGAGRAIDALAEDSRTCASEAGRVPYVYGQETDSHASRCRVRGLV